MAKKNPIKKSIQNFAGIISLTSLSIFFILSHSALWANSTHETPRFQHPWAQKRLKDYEHFQIQTQKSFVKEAQAFQSFLDKFPQQDFSFWLYHQDLAKLSDNFSQREELPPEWIPYISEAASEKNQNEIRYYPIAKLKLQKNLIGVIFNEQNISSSQDSYWLYVFQNNGKLSAILEFAQYNPSNPQQVIEGQIYENLHIRLTFKEYGAESFSLKNKEFDYFKIDEIGHIHPLKELNDSRL